jgi:molybdopterin biosynthesis enzyme
MALQKASKAALAQSDVVITSGGVSVGPKDLMPKVIKTLGKPGVIISGIAVKPGKPTTIAMINNKPLFSLPGHPTSALLMFHVLIRPILNRMGGKPKEVPAIVNAKATTKIFSARGRKTLVMIKLSRDKTGELLASPASLGFSGAITTLTEADGFITMEDKKQFIQMGETVEVQLFPKLKKGQSSPSAKKTNPTYSG